MAKYRKVNPARWNDPRFRSLSRPEPNGQTLYWFLRTGPQTGIVPGLYEARAGGLADHLGWERADFDRAFSEIEGQKLAAADWEAGVVWVPDAIEDDTPQSKNAATAWGKALAELPECPLKDESFRYVLGFVEGIRQGFAQALREAFEQARATQITDNRIQIPDNRDSGAIAPHARAPAREQEPAGKEPRKKPVDVARLKDARKAARKKAGGGRGPKPDASPSTPALFDCDDRTRQSILDTVDGKNGKAKQRRMVEWIREEVIRVYKTERLRATGNGYVKVGAGGLAAALEIGTACVGYKVTPEQLVAYWLDPANNFTNMKFPSLAFLGNAKNLDRAASAIGRGGGGRARAAARGHGYDDASELDPRVRDAAHNAGLDVDEMTDRELLTVQNAAKAIAAGRSPGMSRALRSVAEKVAWLFKKGG